MIDIENNIVLSTSAFCLWDISIQEKLSHCKDLGFKNIQIAMSTLTMLKDLYKNFNQLPHLSYFNDISILAPWCGFKYGNNNKTRKVIECLKSIDKHEIISRYVFNHDSILDIDVLHESKLNAEIRNPVNPTSWDKFSDIIKQDKLSCVFDLNKAIRSNHSIDTIINEVERFTSAIHLSGFIDDKNRMPIVMTQQEDLLKYLKRFNIEKTPLIIEGLFSPKDLCSIVKEVDLIKSYLQNSDLS